MRISISICLRQHLLHIQSSSVKLRHMFKFNTQRSTIAGSECETFEGTEYRSQSVCQITVRMSNHSVTFTLSNTHIWIRRFSHTLASLQQARSKLHISSQTSIRTHSSLWTVLTHFFMLHVREQSLKTELKDSRSSLKMNNYELKSLNVCLASWNKHDIEVSLDKHNNTSLNSHQSFQRPSSTQAYQNHTRPYRRYRYTD